MLVELAVRDLGVIAEARIPLPPGLTALTGETGAGKTMVVEALGLLCGARPDPSRVRPGADAAVVEAVHSGDGSEGVGSGGDGSGGCSGGSCRLGAVAGPVDGGLFGG